MTTSAALRIGTRNSPLARWQANWVAQQLMAGGHRVELVPIVTVGDTNQHQSIDSIVSPGIFTKELQRALVDGRIDVAVHSLKDLPTDPVEGVVIAAVPEREEVADVLVSRNRLSFEQLPPNAKVGTGSLRRRAQLLHVRDDLKMHDIRGNVDTRIRKLHEGQFDAIVLALAGLKRLGLESEITQVLPSEIMLPAIGQGALAIEIRVDDRVLKKALTAVDHYPTHQTITAERTLLATLQGGCLAPIGAWCRVNEESGLLELSAAVLSVDGCQKLIANQTGSIDSPDQLGERVAQELLSAGASKLIAACANHHAKSLLPKSI